MAQAMINFRIDEKNRVVYKIENNAIIIASCKGHYEL